jgi:NAD(P)H-dependent nitrite reductase small subunit
MAYIDTTLKLETIPLGQSRCIELDGTQVAFFHEPAGLFAIDNLCPHRGAPLNDGFVTDGYVTCPWHQWQFQLKDGICRNIPGPRVAAYPVEIRDGAIWIELK